LPLIRLVARKDIKARGVDVRSGAVFDCGPVDALYFTYHREARFAPKGAAPTQPEPAAPEPAVEEPAAPTPRPTRAKRKPKTYKRADMAAETPDADPGA
jgi:hypothetical protein